MSGDMRCPKEALASPNPFHDLYWVATGALARDREQSHRLHEPDHLIDTIDPITGHDIDNVVEHPLSATAT